MFQRVGTGQFITIVKRLIEKLELKDVYLLGRVSENEKINLMQRAWLLVCTSMKEGFGIVILEAAACATPSVAYNVPGIRDIVRHMITGILVEPNNIRLLSEKIVQVLTDTKLRNVLSRNARIFAKRYDWDRIVELFLKVLESVY